MVHRSDDELLGYALETLASDEERADIVAHLSVCAECRARLERIQKDIEVIGSVKPHCGVLPMPKAWSRERFVYAVLRAAALIVVGFLVGLGASNRIPREPIFVSSAYIEPSPPNDGLTTATVSDATAVPAQYYNHILEQGE